jgi:RimJ/RimL family protein N-acetyltransferase
MEKIGMRREGTLRQAARKHGQHEDMHVYVVNRDERFGAGTE